MKTFNHACAVQGTHSVSGGYFSHQSWLCLAMTHLFNFKNGTLMGNDGAMSFTSPVNVLSPACIVQEINGKMVN